MNLKLLLFLLVGLIVVSHSANTFAENGDKSEVKVPDVFAKEDYMTLDKQNYSDGDTVKMSGFIEGKGGHVLTIIIVNPSGELKSAGHSYGPTDSFGMETRIIPISWDDGIYKIVASSVGEEFVEVFGVNYVLTEDDITKYQQEEEKNKTIKQIKNLLGNHVGVRVDQSNYEQGGMLKIYGYGHSIDDGKTNPDESITLKIYVKNSQTPMYEVEVDLDEYGEFLYYLDTSDDTKWDYTTRTNLPFGTPHGFYNVVAEFAETENEREFFLKATGEKTNGKTDITKTESKALPVIIPSGIKIFEYGMFDAEDNGDLVDQLYVGKKYWFEFEYQNELEASYDIREFSQLIDQNKTENNVLQKIEGSTTLEPSDRLGHGFEWVPEYTGQFKVTSEVISTDDPHVGVVAPQYDLVVVDRPTLKQQITNAIPANDILCNNHNHFLVERANSELSCVHFDTAKRLGWELVQFEEIILDPATKESLLKQYKDLPEVVAFYQKYNDAQVSVRDNHISYFAGSDHDSLMRMNIFFDKEHTLDHMDLHCYFQKVHQFEIPQEDIVNKLENYDCEKSGT